MEAYGRLVLLYNSLWNIFDDWWDIWRRRWHYQVIQRDGRVATLVLC